MQSFWMQMLQNMFMKYSFIQIALKDLYTPIIGAWYWSPLSPVVSWEGIGLDVN